MGPNMETWKISKLRIAMDRVCTKATFISKGSYLNGESKNVMAFGCNKRTERHGSANHKVSCYMCVILHRQGDYIFRFCIPVETFWHKHCFG